ncbi:mechanosensitive ion channel domain-containing protein [Sediminihaliea albiluteola]|uniref:mechanosensitive ion channel domain-containing protein n=1 Tax=Sediminihaliea albiluteola TaxID=2758564 RepID=UPI001C7118CD|nr:mechanosensitive ion channel family protein [Sediminihaliea albiluteola]
MRIIYLALLVSIGLLLPLSLAAQVEPPAADTGELASLSLQHDAEADERIKSRIESIFAEISSLEAIQVEVKEGVVTLSGEAANEADAEKAQRLSGRLEGVVEVEDDITRTLDLRQNVAPLITSFTQHLATFIKALPLLLVALLLVVAFSVAGAYLSRRKTLLNKITPNAFLSELLAQAFRVLGFLLGLIAALNLLGAGKVVATLLGGAGVVGLAIGFAVRDTIENYIASIMLSLRQPFRAKDHVVINDHEGIVVRLTSRATILMTLDGNHLRIPNANVFKGIILNYSTNPERKFSFELGVDAADDPVAAMQTGLKAISALDFVLAEPAPGAVIATVGDSNIVLRFSAWVDQRDTNFGKARSLAIRAVMQVLERRGFTLPEPIYRLRFDSNIDEQIQERVSKPDLRQQEDTEVASTSLPTELAEVAEAALDVSPDTHLSEKVDQELMRKGEDDLLDDGRPSE